MVWVGYAEQDAEQSLRPVAHAGSGDGYLNEIRLTWADREHGRGPAGRAIRAGHHVIFDDLRNDPDFEPWREAALRRGYAACISLPLTVNDAKLGALTIYSGRPHAFNEADVSLLQILAEDLSHGIGVLRLRAERASREAALRSCEARFRALVEQATDGIFVADARGAYIDVNSAGCAMLGYTREELLRLTIADVLDPREVERIGPEVARFEDGEMVVSEWRFRRKDGSNFTGEVRGRQCADGRLQAIVIDITERKARELDLREADQRKDEFLAMLAHELRNPLAICSSAAQFLMQEEITPEFRRQCAQKMQQGMQRASGIIDHLLKFTRPSERGDRVKLDLLAVLKETLALVADQAKIQNITVRAQLPDPPAFVEGDAHLLQQVFMNLFLNAIHAMPTGGRLSVDVETVPHQVSIRVTDTGHGIAPADLGNIFDPFYSKSNGRRGTGLGLPLCYAIVKQHAGAIEVESTPGQGSVFTVRLDLSPD